MTNPPMIADNDYTCPMCGELDTLEYDGEVYDDELYLGSQWTCKNCGHRIKEWEEDE